MKKINENTKVTLTLGQLKKLMNESVKPRFGFRGFIENQLESLGIEDATPEQIDEITKAAAKISGAGNDLVTTMEQFGYDTVANNLLYGVLKRCIDKI